MIVIGAILIATSRPLAKLTVNADPTPTPVKNLFGGDEGWLFFITMILSIIGLGFLGTGIAELV